MPAEPLDIKKILRNWELPGDEGASAMPRRLAETRAPLDPFAAARGDLARLRPLLAARFDRDMDSILPFLKRIDDAIAAMQDSISSAADRAAAEPADELRAELDDALFDLEDLLEVLSMKP